MNDSILIKLVEAESCLGSARGCFKRNELSTSLHAVKNSINALKCAELLLKKERELKGGVR